MLVGWSVRHNFLKGLEVSLHVPIEAIDRIICLTIKILFFIIIKMFLVILPPTVSTLLSLQCSRCDRITRPFEGVRVPECRNTPSFTKRVSNGGDEMIWSNSNKDNFYHFSQTMAHNTYSMLGRDERMEKRELKRRRRGGGDSGVDSRRVFVTN